MAAAPRNITPVVLPAAQLTLIDATPRDFYAVQSDKREWLQWLSRHHLIKNNVDCERCRHPMVLVAREECNGGFSWLCHPCNTCCSVRTGSFFANDNLTTEKTVML